MKKANMNICQGKTFRIESPKLVVKDVEDSAQYKVEHNIYYSHLLKIKNNNILLTVSRYMRSSMEVEK